MKKKQIIVEGKTYRTITAACKAHDVPVSRVYARLEKGWELEKAILTPLLTNTVSKDHLGKVYKSFSEMCHAYNISKQTVSYRLDLGWSLKKALTTKPCKYNLTKNQKATPIEVRGVKYRSILKACRAYHINSQTVTYRVRVKGMTYEEALTASKMPGHECKDHKGNKYSTETARAKAYGLTRAIVKDRLLRGWKLKRALTEPVHELGYV